MKDTNKKSILSVGFISLGCAKNLVDSQIMAGVLLSENITLAPSPEESDIIIINTCAFIEDARKESVETILSACELKASGKCKAILVAGCISQRYKKNIQKSLPDVDAFIGLDELENVGKIIRNMMDGKQVIVSISNTSKKLFDPKIPELVFTGGPYAYLKIAEGCDHYCAFCSIPAIRGSYRSRSIEKIVKEAEQLLERGIKELNLISQDITLYGLDLNNKTNLSELLKALGNIGGKFWIRLLYSFPSHITDDLLNTMNEIPQVCHYLDVPIQHSDPEILRAMGRSDTIEYVNTMVKRIHNIMPDVILRTTCLVGFPGEKEKHFNHLMNFVKNTAFDHLGVFTFSPEEHTKAFHLPDRPSVKTAEKRKECLMLLQRKIVDKKSTKLIGTRAEILLEKYIKETNQWIGRAKRQAPEIDGETFITNVGRNKKAGEFINVEYINQDEYDMNAGAF